MSIEFNCPHCNATIKTSDQAVGKKGTCRQCQKELVVPQPREMQLSPPSITAHSPASAAMVEANSSASVSKRLPRWSVAAGAMVILLMIGIWLTFGRGPARLEGQRAGEGRNNKAASNRKAKTRELADVIEEIEPAVIVIHVTLKNGTAIGSGFIVESSGIAVTNHHVLDGGQSAVARFADGEEYKVEGVLFADPDRDIAIIKLSDADALPTLTLAKTLPRKGESAIAFGAPEGLTFSATEGIVSAIRNEPASEKDASPKAGTFIQTSTPISHGSSGGPLLTRRGEVIGVNTLSLVSGQNLNFAVASIEVLAAIEQSKDRPVRPLPLNTTTSKVGVASIAKTEKPQRLSKGVEQLFERLGKQVKQREERAAEIRSQIATVKNRAREAAIQANDAKESTAKAELESLAAELKSLTTKSFDLPDVDFFQPKTGDVGTCAEVTVEVVQVLSKEQGECLVAPIRRVGSLTDTRDGRLIPRGPWADVRGKAVKLHGLDLTNTVDGNRVRLGRNLLFEVVGTHTYSTVSGGTNTVFEIACLLNTEQLTDTLKATLDRSLMADVDLSIPPLTKDEEKLRVAAVEKKAREAEAERIAAEARQRLIEQKDKELRAAQLAAVAEAKRKRDAEEAEKKATSKLTLAKTFLKSMKRDIARNRLQEIIEEFPDTKAAAEAEKILVAEKLLR